MSSALFDAAGDEDGTGLAASALFDSSALFDAPSAAPGDGVRRVAPAPPAPKRATQPPQQVPPRVPPPRPAAPAPALQPPPAGAPSSLPPSLAPAGRRSPVALPPPLAAAPFRQTSAVVQAGSGRGDQGEQNSGMVMRSQDRGQRSPAPAPVSGGPVAARGPHLSLPALVGSLVLLLILTGFSAASIIIGVITLGIGISSLRSVFKAPAGRRTANGTLTAVIVTLSGLIGLIIHALASMR